MSHKSYEARNVSQLIERRVDWGSPSNGRVNWNPKGLARINAKYWGYSRIYPEGPFDGKLIINGENLQMWH